MRPFLTTTALLTCSNLLMTFAWYAHLKNMPAKPWILRCWPVGLLKRSRNHVHLSADQETASNVGSRRGTPIVLTIASQQMHDTGYQFFQSANGVWLTEAVPVRFIEIP